MKQILPDELINIICNYLNEDKIYEIRLRADKPAMINYGGRNKYIAKNGLVSSQDDAITMSLKDIMDIIMVAGEHSLYAFNDDIVNGYITTIGGIRLGICGTAVSNNGSITSVKDFTSLCIRFPHEILGCSDTVYKVIKSHLAYNVLVISPPGRGKTTMLRDLCRNIATDMQLKNVLVVDERNEIASTVSGKCLLDVGMNVDIMSNCSKKYAFENGVRCMNPDVIITDELYSTDDIGYISEAIGSGVSVLASVHAENLETLFSRKLGKNIKSDKMFDLYIVLSFKDGIGGVCNMYDKNFKEIMYE